MQLAKPEKCLKRIRLNVEPLGEASPGALILISSDEAPRQRFKYEHFIRVVLLNTGPKIAYVTKVALLHLEQGFLELPGFADALELLVPLQILDGFPGVEKPEGRSRCQKIRIPTFRPGLEAKG